MKTMGARSVVFVVGVVGLVLGMSACGSDKKSDNDSTSTKLSFDTDINPILKASCSGSGTCHSSTTKETIAYVDHESSFKAATSAKVKDRFDKADKNAADPLAMPLQRTGETHTISTADREKLLAFLAQ